MSVTSLIGTARNNKKINDVAENFTYWEENGNVSLTLKSGKEITIRFSEKSATVYRGYTAKGKTESIVLDNCMGSGSTGEACTKSNRRFIGIEKEQKYYDLALKRLNLLNFQKKFLKNS